MTSLFPIVLYVVAGLGVIVGLTILSPVSSLSRLGQVGSTWFDHVEDHPLEDQPDCCADDPPIPFRRLRARM
jgi:hypothetical protein